jgi:hypothetical protein
MQLAGAAALDVCAYVSVHYWPVESRSDCLKGAELTGVSEFIVHQPNNLSSDAFRDVEQPLQVAGECDASQFVLLDNNKSPFIHDSTYTIHALVHVCLLPTTFKVIHQGVHPANHLQHTNAFILIAAKTNCPHHEPLKPLECPRNILSVFSDIFFFCLIAIHVQHSDHQ